MVPMVSRVTRRRKLQSSIGPAGLSFAFSKCEARKRSIGFLESDEAGGTVNGGAFARSSRARSWRPSQYLVSAALRSRRCLASSARQKSRRAEAYLDQPSSVSEIADRKSTRLNSSHV